MGKILIIDGHPDSDDRRFVHALADAYVAGALEGGHQVQRIALSRAEFPILRSLAQWADGATEPSIRQAQEDIRWADHVVILYPLWLGDVPALLKAFLEQIARPGFALSRDENRPLLAGRSARLVVTMAMPSFAYRFWLGAHGVRSVERNILKLVGIRPVSRTLIGNVEQAAEKRDWWLAKVRKLGFAAA